mgnify:CR=1 FL=1
MYTLNEDIKDRIKDVNLDLSGRYNSIFDNDKNRLRSFIQSNIGMIQTLEKLGNSKLEEIKNLGGLVGVDGSNNRMGGSYPHYIEAFQAMAKSTIRINDPIFVSRVYTPLLDEKIESSLILEEEVKGENKDSILANLEVEAAIEGAKKLNPHIILMDGGLIRYNIYALDKWNELVSICMEKNILLAGVIKDIKTSIIGDELKKNHKDIKGVLYDRELLYGLLNYGEYIPIGEDVNKKEKKGYTSAFIRSSLLPMVIGVDIISEQGQFLEYISRLVLSLTPENSRGVPLWLDIIDKEVKISDDMLKALLERYLDRGIYQRFFVSERDKRS